MNRTLRVILVGLLLVASAFAAWIWFRPYAWNADPAARCEVLGVQVRKDQSFFWVDVHVKVLSDQSQDPSKPVLLHTSKGREIEPADTTTEGETGGPVTGIWFKFWLDSTDMDGPLTLRINEGELSIKDRPGLPVLADSKPGFFTTHHW